jgi:beta-xylosidase
MPRKDGTYVIYFTAQDNASGRQCLGRGTSTTPAGPFTATESKPFICQTNIGGDIDPSPFRDSDGTYYLYWKNDGNCCGFDTYLWAQRMAPDGMTMLGSPVRLTHEIKSWEGEVVEAPTMWKHDGKYNLFFSGNGYGSLFYAVGYATCKGPLGPCTQAPENPILQSKCSAAGPGGQTIVTDADGQDWMLYAAWPADAVNDPSGPGRELWMDRLDWKNDKPVVEGPTCTKEPAPAP